MDDNVLEDVLQMTMRQYAQGVEFDRLARRPVPRILDIGKFMGLLTYFWAEVYLQDDGDPARSLHDSCIYRPGTSVYEPPR